MELEYVLAKDDNIDAFHSVLPKDLATNDSRLSLGAIDEYGEILGVISWRIIDSEYDVDWIFVPEKSRLQGVGSGLMNEFYSYMVGTGQIYPVSITFEASIEEDKIDLFAFFSKFWYLSVDQICDRYYLTTEDIKNSADLKSLRNTNNNISWRLFFDANTKTQMKTLSFLSEQHGYEVADYEAWKKDCVPNLCRCVYKGNDISDLIIVQKAEAGNLVLSYLYGSNPREIMALLASVAGDAAADYPNATVIFDTVSEQSALIAKKLFPEAKTVMLCEASM